MLEQEPACPRLYDWVRVRVLESYDDLPGPEIWLLARRSISNPEEITYYFAFVPLAIPLSTLALVASTRYTVEQCIEEAKGEVGLEKSRSASLPQLVPPSDVGADGSHLAGRRAGQRKKRSAIRWRR